MASGSQINTGGKILPGKLKSAEVLQTEDLEDWRSLEKRQNVVLKFTETFEVTGYRPCSAMELEMNAFSAAGNNKDKYLGKVERMIKRIEKKAESKKAKEEVASKKSKSREIVKPRAPKKPESGDNVKSAALKRSAGVKKKVDAKFYLF